MAMVDIVS